MRWATGLLMGGLAIAVTLGAAVIAPGSAWATVENLQSGYWSQLPGGPQVPSGGLEVASDPSGPEAVSAIRFSLQPGVTPSTLTLEVSNAQPAGQVAVVACPTSTASTDWKSPSGAGSFSDAPKGDCSAGSVEGQLSPDAKTMTFALQDITVSSTVNVVLEPDQAPSPVPAGPSSTGPTFDIAFDPVTPADVATTGTPTPTTVPPATPAGAAPAPVPMAGPPPAQGGSGLGAALPASSGLATGPALAPANSARVPASVGPATPTPTNQAAPSLASPAVTTGPQTQGSPGSPASTGGSSRDRRRAELVLGFFLMDILALMAWQRFHPSSAGTRPALTIYDPPPVAAAADAGGLRAGQLGV